jgi:hypothetical protein
MLVCGSLSRHDRRMINEIKTAMAELEYAGTLNQLARCGGLSAVGSGGRFTVSPNLDAHCSPPGSWKRVLQKH